jgi:hypothetical protein
MKLTPDFPIDHKVKVCVCHKTEKVYKVNKRKYTNNVMFTIFGGSSLLIAGFLSPIALVKGTELSKIAWFGIFIGWVLLALIVAKTVRLKKEGHKIFCALRRVVIDYTYTVIS